MAHFHTTKKVYKYLKYSKLIHDTVYILYVPSKIWHECRKILHKDPLMIIIIIIIIIDAWMFEIRGVKNAKFSRKVVNIVRSQQNYKAWNYWSFKRLSIQHRHRMQNFNATSHFKSKNSLSMPILTAAHMQNATVEMHNYPCLDGGVCWLVNIWACFVRSNTKLILLLHLQYYQSPLHIFDQATHVCIGGEAHRIKTPSPF